MTTHQRVTANGWEGTIVFDRGDGWYQIQWDEDDAGPVWVPEHSFRRT